MTQADILYRAFGELMSAADKDIITSRFIDSVVKAPETDSVTVTHNLCRVDTDWLDAIERGLVFVGRAIEEDRQFIRSEGEVQPIEKVKRISRESVQHLSRHSDLITRKQKEEIVPDKLYTVERDSDYAVYENKFLYLLLCRVREFASVRYEAIMAAYKEYRGEYTVKKNVVTATRRLSFTVNLSDEQDDVISAPADRECTEALERIDKILQSVDFYLHTPLMTEVSHTPRIRPNITKTNVLMMNKNFNEALILYEFLLAYEKEGYTVEKTVNTLSPLPGDGARELAVPALLAAFLVYEHGLGLEEYLKGEFDKEEERRKDEAQKELVRAIKALKKRIKETGEGAEEYMLNLEKRNAELEKDEKLLGEARLKIEQLNAAIGRLKEDIKVYCAQIEELEHDKEKLVEEMRRQEEEFRLKLAEMERAYNEKIEELNREHAEETERIKREAQEAYDELKASAKREYDELKASAEAELSNLKEAHEGEIRALNGAHDKKIQILKEEQKAEREKLRADFESRLEKESEKLRLSRDEAQNTASELTRIREELRESDSEKDVLEARLTATRREYGLLTEADDFTTEEGFTALEHEFEVLGKLVRDEWTDVKKMLRKEFYGGIRETMRAKKPQKSKEYRELSEKTIKRRAGKSPKKEEAPEKGQAAENAAQRAQDGEKEED